MIDGSGGPCAMAGDASVMFSRDVDGGVIRARGVLGIWWQNPSSSLKGDPQKRALRILMWCRVHLS